MIMNTDITITNIITDLYSLSIFMMHNIKYISMVLYNHIIFSNHLSIHLAGEADKYTIHDSDIIMIYGWFMDDSWFMII